MAVLNLPVMGADGPIPFVTETGGYVTDSGIWWGPADASGVRVIVEKRTFTAPNHYKGYSFYLNNKYLGLQLADDGVAPGYVNVGAPVLVVPADGQWQPRKT